MLSPIEIQNKEFKKAKFGGYNTEDVNDFLDEVIESFHTIIRENHELKDKMNMLNESLQYYRTMEATIQNALVLAEKTAQDTKALAHEKADQIKMEAEQKAENIVEKARQEVYVLHSQIEDLKKQHASFKIQISKVLQGQLEILDQFDVETAEEENATIQQLLEDEELDIAKAEAAIGSDLFFTKEYEPVCEA
jgi:cell division initiation protein